MTNSNSYILEDDVVKCHIEKTIKRVYDVREFFDKLNEFITSFAQKAGLHFQGTYNTASVFFSTSKIVRMAHDKEENDPSLKGLNKIFNGRTMKGRAHVAMATYAAIGGLVFYLMTRPSRPPPEKREGNEECIKFSTYNIPSTKM